MIPMVLGLFILSGTVTLAQDSAVMLKPQEPTPLFLGQFSFEYKVKLPVDSEGRLDTYLTNAHQTPDGELWFSTAHYMARYDGRKVQSVNVYPNDTTTYIMTHGAWDHTGRLWHSDTRVNTHIFDGDRSRMLLTLEDVGGRSRPTLLPDPGSENAVLMYTDDLRFYRVYDDKTRVLLSDSLSLPYISQGLHRFVNEHGWSQYDPDGKRHAVWFRNFDGQVWRGLYDENLPELYRFEGHAYLFQEVFNKRVAITDVLPLDVDVALVSTNEGIYRLECSPDSCTSEIWLPGSQYQYMARSLDGRIHITSGELYYIYDGAGLHASPMPSNGVFGLYADNENNIWMHGRNGVVQIQRKKYPTIGTDRPAGQVVRISQSTDGIIYYVQEDGLYRADIPRNIVTNTGVRMSSRMEGDVNHMFMDRNGLLWLDASPYLFALDPSNNYATVFSRRIGWNVGVSINGDREALLIFGTSGIWKYDPALRDFKVSVPFSFPRQNGVHAWATSQNAVWVFRLMLRLEESLNYYDGNSFGPVPVPHALKDVRISYGHSDFNTGMVALLRFGNEIWLYFEEKFIRLAPVLLDEIGEVREIEFVPGSMWLSTEKGVFRLEMDEIKSCFSDTTTGKLTSIGDISIDWDGVVPETFLPCRPAYFHLSRADGLPSSNMDRFSRSFVLDDLGRTWIATSRGVLVYDPSQVFEIETPPGVRINGIRDENGSLIISKNQKEQTEQQLPLGLRTVGFDISVFSFFGPDRQLVRYRLLGLDDDWNETSVSEIPLFAGLLPGSYSFEVFAANAAGKWTENPVILSFVIPAKFHETRLFHVILILALMGAVAFFFQYRGKIQKRRADELEDVVRQRTRELQYEKESVLAANKIINRQSDELIRQDELKNKLYANISHELRTPITLIRGPLENLLRIHGRELPPNLSRHLQITNRNATRLEQLVEQLLDLTRIDRARLTARLRPLNLSRQLVLLSEAFGSYAQYKQVDLQVHIPTRPVYINGDPDMIEKVFMNLLSNAIKFTPKGGRVGVHVKSKSGRVQIEVSDSGPGILEGEIDKIFDRFYKVASKSRYNSEGLGIGLSLTREFVELMKGEVSVLSNPGQGTTFTVTFPKMKGATSEEGEVSASDAETTISDPLNRVVAADIISQEVKEFASEETHKNKLTKGAVSRMSRRDVILIVDDNPDMVQFTADLLSERYRIETASSGVEALRVLDSTEVDMVITDLMMPEMDGMMLVRAIRSRQARRSLPVIMLSAVKSEEMMVTGFEIGLSDYITKPFNAKELLARVNRMLELARVRDSQVQSKTETLPKDTSEVFPEADSGKASSFNGDTRDITASDALIEQVTWYVEQHLSRTDLNTGLVADHVKMSIKQLNRRLQTSSGLSTAEFIREIRLQRALHMLTNKQKETVGEVMHAVGFTHQHNFSKRFEERFGRKPAELLK